MNQRVGHHHASDVNAVIHWYGRRQYMRWSSSTDAYDVLTCLKDIRIMLLLLIQKEQHKRSFQPHIIISVLLTFKLRKYLDKSL